MGALTRIILDATRDLAGQVKAAQFAIKQERPSDGVMIVSIGGIDGDHYGVRWNKRSLRVYPPQEPTP